MLRILLLGTPLISLDNAPLKINRKLQRTLLFFLAERGGPVGREELIGMLWPEKSNETAHRYMSQALARLRAELSDHNLLISDISQVSLDFKRIYVDVLEFRALLKRASSSPRQLPAQTALTEDVAQAFTNAIRLWRSPQFMAGVDLSDTPALDNWYTGTRQELELLRLRLAERLADHAMAHGDMETTLSWLRAALQSDEMDEKINARLLNLMIDMGLRSQAITLYTHLKELYEQEGDFTVPAAIQKAFDRIIEGNDIVNLPGWPAIGNNPPRLVGRATILSELRAAYHRGGTVILYGEGGAGKTRLVQELFCALGNAPRLLLAIARPTEGRLPFQVIIEMLRRYITNGDWQKLSPYWGQPIAALLPELQLIRPEFTSMQPNPDKLAQTLLFEAIQQLLLLVSTQRRLLVFIDDAQWADESSLQALAFLLQHGFFDTHGLLVISFRSESRHPQLEPLLDLARHSNFCFDLSLPLLEKKEISELATIALGQPAKDILVDRLAKDTGGNPLFILMTLRSLLEIQVEPNALQTNDVLPLPSGIQALVRDRLREANPQTRQVVFTAAMIGSTFELDVLEKASQLPEEVVVQAIEEMEKLSLVRAVGAQAQQRFIYVFIHNMIREALLLEVSQPFSRLLHRRVAQALQDVLGERAIHQAAVLAQHYELAGDLNLAFDWWLKAARRARQLFSLNEAEAAYQRAEKILREQDRGLNNNQVYELYTGWGEMIFEAHGTEAPNRVYSTLLSLGKERQSPLLIGTALSGLCNAAVLARDANKGLEYANQALVYLAQSRNTFELAQAHNRRGDALASLNRYTECYTAFTQSLAISAGCQEVDCLNVRASSYYHIGLFLRSTGWPVQDAAMIENALQENPFLMHPFHQLCLFLEMIIADNAIGNYPAAREYSNKALDLAQKLQNWQLLGYVKSHAAQTQLAMGNLDASLDYIERAKKLGQTYDLPAVLTRVYLSMGDIYYSIGAYQRAIEIYQNGIDVAIENNKKWEIIYRQSGALGMVGQVERGLRLLTQAIAEANAVDNEFVTIPARVSLARLYFLSGNTEKAWQEGLDAIHQAHERGIYLNPPYANLMLGGFALSQGAVSAAKEYARLMIDQPRQPGNILLEIGGLALLLRAQNLERQSDPQIRNRLIQRLDEVEALARHPDIAPYFYAYQQKMLASLQAP